MFPYQQRQHAVLGFAKALYELPEQASCPWIHSAVAQSLGQVLVNGRLSLSFLCVNMPEQRNGFCCGSAFDDATIMGNLYHNGSKRYSRTLASVCQAFSRCISIFFHWGHSPSGLSSLVWFGGAMRDFHSLNFCELKLGQY